MQLVAAPHVKRRTTFARIGTIFPILQTVLYEDSYHYDMNPREAFALVLRQKRVHKGLTQADLALQAHVTSRYVRNLEAGTSSPTLDTFFRIALALDTTAHELVASIQEKMNLADLRHMD